MTIAWSGEQFMSLTPSEFKETIGISLVDAIIRVQEHNDPIC